MQKIKLRYLLLLLSGITFFAYFGSFGNPFIWDDEQFITSNVYVQTFDVAKIFTTSTTAGAGVVSNYYRPLSTLSFAIDNKIWGANPFGFHLTNTMFHIAAGIFLFLFLLEMGMGRWGSFFISLFFLIHPVQTEAVVYLNSRGDSMFAATLFASLLLFVHALKRKKIWLYVLLLFLYICSIFYKETAMAAFPLYFIIVGINMFKKGQKFPQSIQLYTKAIFTALGAGVAVAGYLALRLTVLNFENTLNFYVEQNTYSTHLLVRLFTFAKVLWVYLGILLWPHPLHMERSIEIVTSLWSGWVIGMIGLIIIVLVLAWIEMKKKKTTWIFLGLCISGCLLVPVSGIIPISGILYEHWLYLPMIGFFLMVYGTYELVASAKFLSKKRLLIKKFLISFGIVLSILYLILTIMQNAIWSDPVGFYRYTLQFAPNSVRLHNNLGMSLADRGDLNGAITEYKKGISLDSQNAILYNNLGNVLRVKGEYKMAEVYLKKALQLAPQLTVARINLIKVYLFTKQYDLARKLAQGNQQILNLIQQYESQH